MTFLSRFLTWIGLTVGWFLMIHLLSGCVSRGEIEAAIWMNDGLPLSYCGKSRAESKNPKLWDYGFYRKLDDGTEELMPYCDPVALKFFSMHEKDFNRLLDATLPKGDE